MTLAELEVRVHAPGSEDHYDTAVLATDVAIADAQGEVWKATSLVTADIFVKHMVDLSSTRGATVFSVRDGLSGYADWDAAFRDRPLLSGVVCVQDDRFYRTLLLQDYGGPAPVGRRPASVIDLKFHYSIFRFDIAAMKPEPNQPAVDRDLAIRVNDGKSGEYLQDLNGGSIGSFGFAMSWAYLLSNSAYAVERGRWIEGDGPLPLVFHHTEDIAAPQPHVRVVPWNDPRRRAVQGQ